MYSLTPWLGRAGLEDRPTTAIVLYLVRISKIGSALGDAPSGSKIFIAWSARFCRALGEQAAHHREQLLIFCRDTHGHAQRLREAHPAKRPHDDTVVQQFVTKLLRLRPYLDENKIGVAAHGAQSKLIPSVSRARSMAFSRIERFTCSASSSAARAAAWLTPVRLKGVRNRFIASS